MIDQHFNPSESEQRIYKRWEEAGCFKPDMNSDGEPYCIVIPPPNVTGVLHMGHALNHTLQDVLIRFERMRGKKVLWQPGTDHAGIATQMVVERKLGLRAIRIVAHSDVTPSLQKSGNGKNSPAAPSSTS